MMKKEIDMQTGNQNLKSVRIIIAALMLVVCCQCNNASDADHSQTMDDIHDNKDIPTGLESPEVDESGVSSFVEEIRLFDKELLGSIETKKNTWLVLAGRNCTDCDANLSVYIYPMHDFPGADTLRTIRYSYPGKEYNYEDDSLIFESRVFWGDCLPRLENIVIWYQRQLNDDGWDYSYYWLQLQDKGLMENRSDTHALALDEIENRIMSEVCTEIPPIERTSEP